ncbi:MAG: hypothetical protein ACI4FX_00715 [Agathobacter sp.]
MKKRIRQALGLLLAFVTLLTTTIQSDLPALHAEEKKDTQLSGMYEWHRAMTVDDLRGAYNEMTGLRDGYDNQWVPIIIVAEYEDGTQYYLNRNTTQRKLANQGTVNPSMNPVSSSDSVGLLLANGMKSKDTFVTKGDLGAMHMLYHGVVKKSYGDDYIQAEAWSLTKDKVQDYSEQAAQTVYGVRRDTSNKLLAAMYLLDQNDVDTWGGFGTLPVTHSPSDKSEQMNTGWTFQQDRKDGYFLISDMFAQLRDSSSLALIDAPSWGCGLTKYNRYSDPDDQERYILDTPSQAAAYTRGDDGNVVQISENKKNNTWETNNELRNKMIKQYDEKYKQKEDKKPTRAWFKIYIGKELEGSVVQQTGSITGTKDYRLSGTNIAKGVEVTVEEGATLTIKENTYCYLDGTITNKGTIIVEKGATITSAMQGPGTAAMRTGKIDCQGGKLLVMEGAKLYLAEGLLLNNNASVVNRGLIIVGDTFEFNDSMIQMADGGRLMIGFANNSPSTFHCKNLDTFVLEYEIDNTGGNDCAPTLCDYSKRNANSKIILEKNSAVDIGCYSAEFDSNKTVWFPDLVVGLDQGAEKFYTTMQHKGEYTYLGNYTFGKDNGSYSSKYSYVQFKEKYYDIQILLRTCYECKN